MRSVYSNKGGASAGTYDKFSSQAKQQSTATGSKTVKNVQFDDKKTSMLSDKEALKASMRSSISKGNNQQRSSVYSKNTADPLSGSTK